MPTPAKMEITLKIHEFPTDVRTDANGWKIFELESEDRVITVTVNPEAFQKFINASKAYPYWIAAIRGKMGQATPNGFILEQVGIQIFEKKPKESRIYSAKSSKPETASSQQSQHLPKPTGKTHVLLDIEKRQRVKQR